MYIGLTFTLNSNTELLVYDNSSLDSPYPTSLDKLQLIVSSSTDTTKSYTFDCIDYVFNHRVSTEILTLVPSDLDMTTTYFPDGVYTFKYTINNYEEITKKIVIFETVRQAILALNDELNYGVEVGENAWELPGDYSDSDLETVRLANALLDSITTYASEVEVPEDTETQVLELLTKLSNLLQLT